MIKIDGPFLRRSLAILELWYQVASVLRSASAHYVSLGSRRCIMNTNLKTALDEIPMDPHAAGPSDAVERQDKWQATIDEVAEDAYAIASVYLSQSLVPEGGE